MNGETKVMKLKVVLAMLGLVLLNACSVNGNIVDTTTKTTTYTASGYADISSGGVANATTQGGYKFSATIGAPVAAVISTTSGGYTIYSNMQGAASSTTSHVTYQ